MDKKILPFMCMAAALAIFGAGCGDSPVSLDKYKATQPAQTDQQGQLNASSTPDVAGYATDTQALAAGASTTVPIQPTNSSTTEPMFLDQAGKLAFPGIFPEAEVANKQVRIKTAKGDIVFELLPQEGPNAASNFYYLVGRKFYDGLNFHRVEPGFVVQGGDPQGNGSGGPGYSFTDDAVKLPYKEGIVAMANAGANTNGSQFFIMLADNPLPPKYSIFGRVVSGMDVVKKIAIGDKMESVTLEPLKK
ncbi:MAG: peptidylprolyl isomerase [Patescibacteria group bacterium]